ncbi:hypothetical protein BB558_003181 [Smittium angustum]|uniref:3-keto-steroid reductase n=1 Tax=Smittium angustum TaxID=133377 RepID=A0A2U1J6N4_SMIAN|nr:hypothetical protein BB558_003181 [Smittium angustum]
MLELQQVAIITGKDNREGSQELVLVLACRNQDRAKIAGEKLLRKYNNKNLLIETITLDTSDSSSVLNAAKVIETRYKHVNYLFCNAGIMSISGLDWKGIVNGILKHPLEFVGGTEALVQNVGLQTKEGLGLVFATNFFGHYLLLEFDKNDIQHVRGKKPYESSKFITDQISVVLDKQILKEKKIRSFVVEPGNVATNILSGIASQLFIGFVYSAFLLVRLVFGIFRLTVTPWNGSYGAFYAATENEQKLDGSLKYNTCCTRLGSLFVDPQPIKTNKKLASYLVDELDQLVAYTTGNSE